MKEIYKNPILYYILVPVVIVFWPFLVWAIYLPDAEHNWQKEKKQYTKAQEIIKEILALDPDRLKFGDSKTGTVEFDYATAIQKIASLCEISSSDYTLSSGVIITSGGKKSQSARVGLKKVGIVKFTKFLSTMQFRWANLQCASVKLTRKKGLADVWDIDLDLKYYY